MKELRETFVCWYFKTPEMNHNLPDLTQGMC